MWTKDEIRQVPKTWDTKTLREIAADLQVSVTSVAYIIKELRKQGVDLPRKHKNGVLMNLIKEVALEAKHG